MQEKTNYTFTFYACCLGSVLQAAIVNVTPLLFIPLKELLGLSYSQLGFLVLVNFVTQFICDFTLGAVAEKFGIRKFLVAAPSAALSGFLLFSAAPLIFSHNPYIGLVLATIVFSAGGGLLELLLSPVVNALPSDNKSATMSMLHSFYAWGQVGVVLVTTLLIALFGRESWQAIYLIWSILAIVLIVLFTKAPLASPQKGEGKGSSVSIIKKPMFILALLLMLGGGASEIGLSQWASSFMEKGMGIPKATGDILGMCMFGVMMGTGRSLFGKFGTKMRVVNVLLLGSLVAAVCYAVVGFTQNPFISLVFCALCGLAVSLLWPCTLTITAEYFPYGGTMMFALLASGGDAGCSSGPWLIGAVIDKVQRLTVTQNIAAALSLSVEQVALRAGILSGAVFPLITFFGLLIFKKQLEKKRLQD